MAETQDTEITLGTGKLLGIFFGLVALCAVFFTMGYMLGHSTASGANTQIVGSVPSGNAGGKPSAGNKTSESPQTIPAGSGPDSSVYNSVNNKTPNTQLTPPANSPTPQPATTQPADQSSGSQPPPELKNAGASGSYMVQVAAVSKQEDAEILVSALRKKQYPVFVVSNVPGDSLFHVQVGPFTDPKDAESMRSRLAGDGYNAIVKK